MTSLLGLLKRPQLALLALALGLSACAGDDSGESDTETTNGTTATTTGTATAGTATTTTDGTTEGTTEGTTSETTTDGTTSTTAGGVDYEGDIQPIWDASCVVGCHTDGGSKADLPLGPGMSHGSLVGAQSVQLASMKIVEPGDPDNSYLWHKLNGTQADVGGSGLSMPFGAMLDGPELEKIETWILDGANP